MMLNKFQMSIQQLQEKVRGQEEVGHWIKACKFSQLEIFIPFDRDWNELVMNLKMFNKILLFLF